MEKQIEIRHLTPNEIPAASALIWDVFLQYVAPDYTEEGVQTFRRYIHDTEKLSKLVFHGAFDAGELVGVICVREPQHIGGFFVRGDHHGAQIGRALFEAMTKDYEKQEFTVNSSPFAVGFYKRLGFVQTMPEQCEDGIRFTPMHYKKD